MVMLIYGGWVVEGNEKNMAGKWTYGGVGGM